MDYDVSVRIRRPPDVVYATLVDIQRYATAPGSPVSVMEKIPPGPTTVCTRWREVIRLGPFLTMTTWSEVTALEPSRRIEERFRGRGFTGTLRYTIEPVEGGCTLRQQQTITPRGLLRLFAGPMGRMFEPRMRGHLEAIRDGLEREVGPSSSPVSGASP